MALLSRDQILAAPIPSIEIDVAEWGGSVRLRALSGRTRMLLLDAIYANEKEREEWDAKSDEEKADLTPVHNYDQALLTLLFAIVGEDNEPIFTLSDYEQFLTLNYPTQVSLWQAYTSLSATPSRDDQKKSSASTLNAGSSTASRSRSAKRSRD